MTDTEVHPANQASMPASPGQSSHAELEDIRSLLWGAQISDSVFARWSQGFEFSEVEPTALVQHQGGPCAVIAPVQAYLLQSLLQDASCSPAQGGGGGAASGAVCTFSEVPKEKCRALLVQAITNILSKCKTTPEQRYRIVSIAAPVTAATKTLPENPESPGPPSEAPFSPAPVGAEEADFHRRLTVTSLEKPEQVMQFYADHFTLLSERFGVLLFLYSVMLTRGVDQIKDELNDVTEPLIDNTYGYGSQSLINLMLTGSATAHVFDNFEDVGGMRLQGLSKQSEVGFITLMEQMRYCTVGSYFKNPSSPVWVMGSETHLSVLFSDEPKLVSPETPSERAKRVFKAYDPDGNNFIQCDSLQEILQTLDLVSEPEYVEIMKQKLDPEKLGIILLNAFLDEFFPEESRSVPDVFRLWHYNGIPGSNDGHQVKYNAGSAVLLETDVGQMVNVTNPMLMCLQTKWPLIEVTWTDRTPSLN